MDTKVARLSCRQCQQRKTKCDKDIPCSACKNAGVHCNAVQRARLPRGRTGKVKNRNTQLDTRVARLESLVKQLEKQSQDDGNYADFDSKPEETPSTHAESKMSKLVASDFWTAMSNEVAGIRETLEESDEEDSLPHSRYDDMERPPIQCLPAHAVIFNHQFTFPTSNVLQPPLESTRNLLLHVYHTRVDCLFKALHWPTTLAAIEK